ncbi:phospholipase [Massilia dura]|uniref:Phospholipase n=1 Tax=Pseudoduganella dura TaxID=321982 RepID=A0A6I3X3D2_9BURK|nr:dienelactone hydrolase family protein [Pseudoduganella dura]MUI11359.1 phospholipase [Pseudoduganella dura]GGX95639.1 phospholipase/carboxylesterase [Pseudoduganella dura]
MAAAEQSRSLPRPPAVIALHGRGQPPAFIDDLLVRLNRPSLRYATPRAPGDAWYPERFMAPRELNQPQLDAALATLDEQVYQLEAAGLERAQIVLLGFSQGACLACEYLYRHPGRWGGLVALTGGLIGPEGTTWPTLADSLAGTPVLMTNGDVDPWVPLARTRASADVFRAMGGRVAERVYPGRPHAIDADEVANVRNLLDELAAGTDEIF